MEKFYPKNFALWRPHLLLLLIFLEAVYDARGLYAGGDGGEIRERRKVGYEDNCKVDEDCRDEFYCDELRKQCFCRNNIIPGLIMFYDQKSDSCLSTVGKQCVMPKPNEDLWKINCVPNALCTRRPHLADIFGICECMPDFEETSEHLCRRKVTMVIQFGDGNPLVSMSRQIGPPIAEGMESIENGGAGKNEDIPSADKGQDSNHQSFPTMTEDDPNAGIQIRKDILDRWVDTRSTASGFQLSLILTAAVSLVLFIAN